MCKSQFERMPAALVGVKKTKCFSINNAYWSFSKQRAKVYRMAHRFIMLKVVIKEKERYLPQITVAPFDSQGLPESGESNKTGLFL